MPIAISMITKNAPKSGWRSSRAPVNSITSSIGRKPFFRLST